MCYIKSSDSVKDTPHIFPLSHLMGQVVRYEVGNVYDPAYTLVCKIPKKGLPQK